MHHIIPSGFRIEYSSVVQRDVQWKFVILGLAKLTIDSRARAQILYYKTSRIQVCPHVRSFNHDQKVIPTKRQTLMFCEANAPEDFGVLGPGHVDTSDNGPTRSK